MVMQVRATQRVLPCCVWVWRRPQGVFVPEAGGEQVVEELRPDLVDAAEVGAPVGAVGDGAVAEDLGVLPRQEGRGVPDAKDRHVEPVRPEGLKELRVEGVVAEVPAAHLVVRVGGAAVPDGVDVAEGHVLLDGLVASGAPSEVLGARVAPQDGREAAPVGCLVADHGRKLPHGCRHALSLVAVDPHVGEDDVLGAQVVEESGVCVVHDVPFGSHEAHGRSGGSVVGEALSPPVPRVLEAARVDPHACVCVREGVEAAVPSELRVVRVLEDLCAVLLVRPEANREVQEELPLHGVAPEDQAPPADGLEERRGVQGVEGAAVGLEVQMPRRLLPAELVGVGEPAHFVGRGPARFA